MHQRSVDLCEFGPGELVTHVAEANEQTGACARLCIHPVPLYGLCLLSADRTSGIRRLRIDRARQYLAQSDTLAEIALRVAYIGQTVPQAWPWRNPEADGLGEKASMNFIATSLFNFINISRISSIRGISVACDWDRVGGVRTSGRFRPTPEG